MNETSSSFSSSSTSSSVSVSLSLSLSSLLSSSCNVHHDLQGHLDYSHQCCCYHHHHHHNHLYCHLCHHLHNFVMAIFISSIIVIVVVIFIMACSSSLSLCLCFWAALRASAPRTAKDTLKVCILVRTRRLKKKKRKGWMYFINVLLTLTHHLKSLCYVMMHLVSVKLESHRWR